MRAHIKNDATDKEMWLFLLHAKQDNKATPRNVSDQMCLGVMIKAIFKEEKGCSI